MRLIFKRAFFNVMLRFSSIKIHQFLSSSTFPKRCSHYFTFYMQIMLHIRKYASFNSQAISITFFCIIFQWLCKLPEYTEWWLRVFFICDVIQLSDKEGNVYHKKPTAVKWIGCIWLYNLFTSYEFMAMGVCAMNMCTLLLLFLVIRIIEWFKSFFLVDSGQ